VDGNVSDGVVGDFDIIGSDLKCLVCWNMGVNAGWKDVMK